MRKSSIFCGVLFISNVIISQTSSISGIINVYTEVNSISGNTLVVSNSSSITISDQVLIVQMKGVSVNSANSINYGSITSYNNCGKYEFAEVASVIGNSIILNAPLQRAYTPSGKVQLVRVPVYQNALVVGTLSCLPWNGSSGGILALRVCGMLTLNSNIDVSGKGFRGGSVLTNSTQCFGDTTSYVESSLLQPNSYFAEKGEGVFLNGITNDIGRGKNSNGGGGGNDINGGGGGGANFGKGGRGGDFYGPASCPANFVMQTGGMAGEGLSYSNALSLVFMGGGGGAGHQNNNTSSNGGNGGGIVIIKASSISGNGYSIYSEGTNVNFLPNSIDGQGGGGGGGSVLLDVNSVTALNVSIKGGYGGSDNYSGPDCHGKGGGGGGGVLWTSNQLLNLSSQLIGGAAGVFLGSGSPFYNSSLNATAGQGGANLSGLNLPGRIVVCDNEVGIKEIHEENGRLIVYPNPSNGYIKLSDVGVKILGPIKLKVLGPLGNLLLSFTFKNMEDLNEANINIDSLESGTYFVILNSDLETHYTKLVIE
ncbi:MAG: T9SS type A sorting domain-containing protein [Bacteroidia bacterium]|nr:T9SS type A sorting domain-containing protein [Bacteroidia bacterium]